MSSTTADTAPSSDADGVDAARHEDGESEPIGRRGIRHGGATASASLRWGSRGSGKWRIALSRLVTRSQGDREGYDGFVAKVGNGCGF